MRQGRPKGVHAGRACVKSHTARCVRKRAAAYFAGAWGAPNKQSKNAAGGRAVDWNIRKGYSNPLLATDNEDDVKTIRVRVKIVGYKYMKNSRINLYITVKAHECPTNRHNTPLVCQTNFCYNCVSIFM